jgi:hypothetical protein
LTNIILYVIIHLEPNTSTTKTMKVITSLALIFASILSIATVAIAAPKQGSSIQIIIVPQPTSNPTIVATKSRGHYLVYSSNGEWFKTTNEKGKITVYSGKNFVLQWNKDETRCFGIAQFSSKRTAELVGSKLVFGPKTKFSGNLKTELTSDVTREIGATKLSNLKSLTLPQVLKGQANVLDITDINTMLLKYPSI